MRDYRIFTKKDMINAEVQEGIPFSYLGFREKETEDFYCMYLNRSFSVVRIKSDGYTFNSDKGTWTKYKNKYLINVDNFIGWYK